jgi:hypothetical protein
MQIVFATYVSEGEVADLGDVFAGESQAGRLRGFEVFTRFYEIGSLSGLTDFTDFIKERKAKGPIG